MALGLSGSNYDPSTGGLPPNVPTAAARLAQAPLSRLGFLWLYRHDACPVGGVEGFDSIAGIAATIHLEQQLGLSDLRDNVFLSPDGKGAQSLSEIVDELHALRTAPEED